MNLPSRSLYSIFLFTIRFIGVRDVTSAMFGSAGPIPWEMMNMMYSGSLSDPFDRYHRGTGGYNCSRTHGRSGCCARICVRVMMNW